MEKNDSSEILPSGNITNDSVSVVIPALNEEQFIGRCLSALTSLAWPPELLEIIVVDNGSTDRTASIAREHGAEVLHIPAKTVGCLRNTGARAAQGEIIAFLDADCIPDKHWIVNATRLLAEEDCVTGSRVATPGESSWIEELWYAENRDGRYVTNYINSGNLIVRKKTFWRVGGFNEALPTGEDAEFCVRAGKTVRIIADSTIRVQHLGNPKTLSAFLRREIWHGLGALGTLRQHPLDKPLIGTIIFLTGTIAQFTGVVLLTAMDQGPWLLAAGSLTVAFLLLATVLYRMIENPRLKQDPRLLVLYYLYYLGRSVSLFLLLFRRGRLDRKR